MDKDDLWVIFKVAGNMYAVNSGSIEGIDRVPEQVTAVPEAESYIQGIVKLRGKIITLIDLWEIFGVKPDKPADIPEDSCKTMMIMMKFEDEQGLALIVDEIVGVEQIGEIYHNTSLDKIGHSELVGRVASTLDGNDLLLLIDEKQVNHMLEESKAKNGIESAADVIELS
ncbi:chemotaxis protein CheW [Clostridium sp. Marseille-P2415]|uniref:chemotaxis protein CheW n=1 Tax=Clostridium sp. Marseille-P2415 TaxID=1805471 RepID=UPI0009886A2B|nr:chemotaxis protein CheW [Clostridium sp. Marseille-P2415]